MNNEAEILSLFYGYFTPLALAAIVLRVGTDWWTHRQRAKEHQEMMRPGDPGDYVALRPEDIDHPAAQIECWPNGNVRSVRINKLKLWLAEDSPSGSLTLEGGGSGEFSQVYHHGGFTAYNAFNDRDNHSKICWKAWLGKVKAELKGGEISTIYL